MVKDTQEAFREPPDPTGNPSDTATNWLAGPLPLFALVIVILAVVGIVAFVMISGATR